MFTLMKKLILIASLLLSPLSHAQRGPVAGLSTSTPYLIYYGNWDISKVEAARDDYELVILHPNSNITPAEVATIRSGPDTLAGTADDVTVLAYISVGEDNRPAAPVVGDGNGPRVDPRSADTDPLSGVAPLGDASTGGGGYASYYLDDENSDGIPDSNATFGSPFVNPGDPAWYQVIRNNVKATDGVPGLEELLTATTGLGYACDGVFLDTLDTPAPNSFGATLYEWTAPAYQALVKQISDDYPGKILLGNRGLFFYNPNLKTYAYTLRPYLNIILFESYYTDSSGSGAPSVFFDDNKFNFAPKINAEAARSDGFNVLSLGYTTAGAPAALGENDFLESQREQGWLLYRTTPALDGAFNTDAATWNAANVDSTAPVWDSTAAFGADYDLVAPGNQAPPARVGVQQVVADDTTAIVRWDIARDQSGPVIYNLYYTDQAVMNFATATKVAAMTSATPSDYATGPTSPTTYAYEYEITGLTNGTTYLFAVRAEDGLSQEDANTVTIAATPAGPASQYAAISIDGNKSDWASVSTVLTDAASDGVPDIVLIKAANDEDYLYLLVEYAAATDTNTFNSSPSLFLSLDTDNNPATGFDVFGIGLIGAEVSWQNDFAFSQDAANFNTGGTFTDAVPQILPYAANSTFQEYRIARNATYDTGGGSQPVFPNNNVGLAFWSDGAPAEFAGAFSYTFASPPPLPSYYASLNIDGDMSEWENIPEIETDPSGDGTPDIVSVKVANDDDYLYLLVQYDAATDTNAFNGSPSLFLSLDNDNDTATGYNVYGLGEIGAEVSWQNNFAFAQNTSTYNLGAAFTDAIPEISPYFENTSFQEYRIPRVATYNVGGGELPVFPNDIIRLALWSDGGSSEFVGGFVYEFEDATPSNIYNGWKMTEFTSAQLLDPLVSGDLANPDNDTWVNLVEFALGGEPDGFNDPASLPAAGTMTIGMDNYRTLTYTQRADGAVTVTPESSLDLTLWDDSASQFVIVSTTTIDSGLEQVVVRSSTPISSGPYFMRLNVTLNP